MSLFIIANFPAIFYGAFEDMSDWKKVLTHKKYSKFFMVQTTTSSMARQEIPGNRVIP